MSTLSRRTVLGMSAALMARPAMAQSSGVTVVDMLGRTVRLPRSPRKIVLLEANDLMSMSLFHSRPAELVVGWAAVDRFDSDLVRRRFESSTNQPIQVFGRQSFDTVSFEGIVSVDPDLVVATAFMTPGGNPQVAVERLAQFGIPLIFSDAASNAADTGAEPRRSQRDKLAAALRMWGALLGFPARAEELVAFVEQKFRAVEQRLSGAQRVKTYLEVVSLYNECCWSAGTRIWGELLDTARGQSLDGLDAPWTAKVSMEHLIAQQPGVYIATGGGYASSMRPSIGPGLDAQAGRDGLRRLTQRTGFSLLPAVRDGRVHGVWTGLLTIPVLNVLFVELAAKWLHPDLCRDLDPAATLAEINRRFLAQPLDGPLWVDLDGAHP